MYVLPKLYFYCPDQCIYNLGEICLHTPCTIATTAKLENDVPSSWFAKCLRHERTKTCIAYPVPIINPLIKQNTTSPPSPPTPSLFHRSLSPRSSHDKSPTPNLTSSLTRALDRQRRRDPALGPDTRHSRRGQNHARGPDTSLGVVGWTRRVGNCCCLRVAGRGLRELGGSV